MGYSEHAQRPQVPQKPLGRLWGCTHSHRKGGVGKTKCHSVPLQKGHLEGSVGRTWGSGMQHKAGRGSWGTARASSVPRGFLGIPGAGLWPWGSGFQAEKPGCVPGDKQQPLSHSAGHPTLWKHFPRCQQSCRAQLGEITAAPSFQGLFSCPACGSSAQVLVGGSL